MTDSLLKMKKKSHSFKKLDPYKLAEIEAAALDNIEGLLDSLGVEYDISYRRIDIPCPVHGGDNSSGLNLYLTGHTRAGHWVCNTHHCEKFFKPTLIGFVRGVLSHNRYGWGGEEDKNVTFPDTIKYLLHFTQQNYDEINIDYQSIEKRKFESKINSLFSNKKRQGGSLIPRQKVQASLSIPAAYYIERGYSAEILEEYDVGLCTRADAPMYNRIVVPIYDENHEYVIGCTGRTTDDSSKPKWLHSKGFDADNHLYNYWKAKKYIQESSVVILVEGPGDVWKLEENGVHNSVAIFGTYLSEGQKDLLDMLGAMSLIIMTYNDEAGKLGAESIFNQCNKTYRIYFPSHSKFNDIGDMDKDAITADIKPLIEKIQDIN